MSMRESAEHGFTIIELVVVIALLGLLAAVALPKFADLTSEARTAALSGIQGGFTAGVQIVHSKWLATPGSGAGNVSIDGATVVVNAAGWPTVDTANSAQDTASELYGLLMSGALATGWAGTETAAAGVGTATFTLSGTGGGSFNYDAANGLVQ